MKFTSSATGEEYTLETALAHAAAYSGPVGSYNEAHLRILAAEVGVAREEIEKWKSTAALWADLPLANSRLRDDLFAARRSAVALKRSMDTAPGGYMQCRTADWLGFLQSMDQATHAALAAKEDRP